MNRSLYAVLLIFFAFLYSASGITQYRGSQAYNQAINFPASVNAATGSFRFSYPLIKTMGIHKPFRINLVYHFNSKGMFGMPNGWELDVDYILNGTAMINGQQWLIDSLWHDEHFFSSGLKYFNQHGFSFKDEGVNQEIACKPSLTYRFKAQHNDGSESYFSQLGLLVLKRDRFGNQITIEYEQPVHSAEKAKLAAITDNYGNRYTFQYEPNTFIVRYPDGREQRVYFNDIGIKTIVNTMQQRYEINYIEVASYHLLQTILTPSGLMTKLAYDTIPYATHEGNSSMPVVTYFKQFELGSQKIYHETFYHYRKENNYTGYPLYKFTNSSDSLVDSNDQNYRYSVEVKQTNGDPDNLTIKHQVYEYNFMHLPVTIRTLKDNKDYIKADYEYPIAPFKYSRSTNYDKPKKIDYFVWNEGQQKYLPSNRIDFSHDLFGNKTRETHWVYHRQDDYWREIRSVEHQYFTDHFNLLSQTIEKDEVSAKAVQTKYHLTPDKKNHSAKMTYALSKDKVSLWQPWQQINYQYDDIGRETFRQWKWIAAGMPGVQKTHKKTRYHFDKESAILATEFENSLGHVTKKWVDTRNSQLLTKISPRGEKTEYRYNKLNQLIRRTDPEGNVHKTEYYTYGVDGLNAKVQESPLGFRLRQRKDPLDRIITHEQAIGDQYTVLDRKEYNAFGKLALHKNHSGQITTFHYDDQMRLKTRIDPWNNKITHLYNDDDMTEHVFINNIRHRKIIKTPWLFKTAVTHYPLNDKDTVVVEEQVTKNGFDQVIHEQSAILDEKTSKRSSIIQNTYQYNPSHNKTQIKMQGFDGITMTKNSTYDLFGNQHTFTKRQSGNALNSCHSGYRYFYNSENRLVRVVSPPSDSAEQLVNQYRYDENGREIEHRLPNGRSIIKTYTPRGQVQSVKWDRKGENYTVFHHYDADGLLLQLSDTNDQHQYYQRDSRGNITRLTYPDRHEQKYEYDRLNRVVKQVTTAKTTLTYQYNDMDLGKLSAIHSDDSHMRFNYGTDDNGIKGRLITIERDITGTGKTIEYLGYGPFGRKTKSTATTYAGAPVFSSAYRYLPRGEMVEQTVHSWTEAEPATVNVSRYDYDAFRRLTKETHQQNQNPSTQISYQYDGNDNLIKEQRTPANKTIHRHYNALDQLTHEDTTTNEPLSSNVKKETAHFVHDKNGHIVVGQRGIKYQYDDLGLLQKVTDADDKTLVEFEYLPNGLLAHKYTNSDRQSFYYDLNRNALTVLKNQKFYDLIRHSGKYLGTLMKGGGEQLFIANQSTAAKLSRNAQGNQTTTSYAYEGYGQTQRLNGSEPGLDFLWNQELADKTTNLVYLKNRFYHPDLKRFTSRDPTHVDNRYSYANANPILFTDPLGLHSGSNHSSNEYIIAGVVFALLSTLISAVSVIVPATLTATLTISAAVGLASGLAGIASGFCLIGAQLAFNDKESRVAQALEDATIALAVLAIAGSIAAAVPNIVKAFGIESKLVNVLTSWPPRAVATEQETQLSTLANLNIAKTSAEGSDMVSEGNLYESLPLNKIVRPRPAAQMEAEPHFYEALESNYSKDHTYENLPRRVSGRDLPPAPEGAGASTTSNSPPKFISTLKVRLKPQFTMTAKTGDASLQEEWTSPLENPTPPKEDPLH